MNNSYKHAVDVAREEHAYPPYSVGTGYAPPKYRHAEQSGRQRLIALTNALRLADVCALLLAGFGGYFLRFGVGTPLSPDNHLFIYLSTLVTVVSLDLAQAYRARTLTSLHILFNSLLVGCACALVLVLVCGYLSGTLPAYSRMWIAASILLSAILLLMNRFVMARIVHAAAHSDRLAESIVVVGANEHAVKMLETIRNRPRGASSHDNVKILGVFDDRVERELPESLRPRILGTTDEMLHFIRRNHVDRVVVTLPWVASNRIDTLLRKLRTVPVQIDLVPCDIVWHFAAINMARLGGVPTLTIANGRVGEQMGRIKRVEDLVISSLILLLVLPLLLLIAVAIKIDSTGSVIFRQRRHGFNNEVFEVFKFRSMAASASSSADLAQATRDDPRVTRVGRILRRTSLDELPQLFNVLAGQMSIVGPRPHAVQHNLEYGSIISEYFARHNVKPGITGWAQVSGLRGETDTVEKMNRRVQYDLHYIENWSLGFDLKIVFMTAVAVWFDPNAY